MTNGMVWDDLRFVLAVAEHGSLAAAARALGVNHTTVLRRLNAFEEAQRLRVFDRLPDGYVPTSGGEALVRAARQVRGVVDDLGRNLAGQDTRLEGKVRITTTDTLMASVLPRHLAAFQVSHPGVELEVSVANRMADLARRDADVAVRPADDVPETLVGRRICRIAFAIYGGLQHPSGRPSDAGDVWVGPDETLAATTVARWMCGASQAMRTTFRADSFVVLREAAAAGIGLAVLPCYLGDTDDRLRRVAPDPLPELATDLWILTHEDLRRTARVSALTEALAAALRGDRGLFEGKVPDGGGEAHTRRDHVSKPFRTASNPSPSADKA